jgi:murein DD-endopeptidase MepM/ murein hydrolase activator NlpD
MNNRLALRGLCNTAVVIGLLLAWPVPALSAADDAVRAERLLAGIELPTSVPQGGLVVGRAPPGSTIRVGERHVRQTADGQFAFGVGRDETGPAVVEIAAPGAEARRHAIAVQARGFRVERVDGVPPSTVTPSPAIAERIAREQAGVNRARQRDDPRADWAGGFIWPVRGRISGVFGSQRIYNGIPRAFHSGLDVAAPTGTPLRAPAAGVVSFAAPDLYLTGGTVLIDHGHGLSSNFLHLSRIDVSVGDRVEQGQVFGAIGATGRATGPHMHWGMNWFGVRIDPQLLVEPEPTGPGTP